MTDLDARVAALMSKTPNTVKSRLDSVVPVIADLVMEHVREGKSRPFVETAIRSEILKAADELSAALQKPALHEPVKDRASIESSCRFIEQHIATRKCDHPAVSGCWRCNSVYLAKRMRDFLASFDLQGRAKPAQEPVFVDPTDPGYEVSTLREHIRHLERQIRQLHAAKPAQEEITDAESIAKAIYEQWVDKPGYVQWEAHGNSIMQDKARDIARAALRASKGEKT